MPDIVKSPSPACVERLRKHLKRTVSDKVKFPNFDEEINQLLNVLKWTISCGESDSVLLVGPRGCGKTRVINECLKEIKESFTEGDYLVIHLNGFVHTDDSLALRAIIEQLHLDELKGDLISGSFADNLQFVIESFNSGDKNTSQPIIFILNEFQLFCEHRNQTLLYNLFDMSKSSKAPLCVVGVTCRNDITELLEKRVSSRFSHRIILLMPNCSLEERISQFSSYLKAKKKKPCLRDVSPSYIKDWNENIKSLIETPSVLQRLQRQLEIDPSSKVFKNTMFLLVCKISESNPFITTENVEEAFQKYYVDDKIKYLKDLSVLELCLVISMSHHSDIYEGEPFNFEMIVEKYLKFAKRNSAVQITQRPILLKAFERIKALEFIIPFTSSTKNLKKEYMLYNLMVTKSQVKSAVRDYSGLPTDVVQWAYSSVA